MFDLLKIGEGLPVAKVIDQLPPHGPLVVEAPPGTGKTTLVPPAVANMVGKTIVVAPRRVAVRSAARRLSLLDGSVANVGYSIRGEHKDGALVEFVTPGVLVNRLLRDPGLEGVNAVILDEVHERNLDTDLLLAMCMEVAVMRDDLYLVAMSATLDARKFADHMGARILSTQAETHPLQVEYAPHPGRVEGTREFYRHVAELARGTERTLVFVPGAREVDMVCELTGGVPLHGRLSSQEQDEALFGDHQVVVATSVAESSITVPGVRKVVDAGLSRVPRRTRGIQGLVTVSEAKSSADQRAGRAAREAPGTVVSAFSQAEYAKFDKDVTPEIRSADLTSAALTMAVWGSPDLPLLDAPAEHLLDDALRSLTELGAIETDGSVTEFGRTIAAIPVDPRLGAALVTHGAQAAQTVAKLSDADPKRLARMVPDLGPVSAGEVLATAFPGWVAKRVGEREYLLASGTRASYDGPEWIVAAEVQQTKGGAVIRAAEPIAFPAHRVGETTTAELEGGKVRGRKVTSVGAIELSSTPVKLTPDEAMEALTGVTFDQFPLSESEQRLKERLDFLHEAIGSPDVAQGDYSLEVREVAGGSSISNCDMRAAMLRQLPWDVVARLDELAPERIGPGKVEYSSGRPVVRVKLQALFGQMQTATVAGVKVLYHLLSPAGRELAVTDDLESFWGGPYQQVRSEMRGRYPKHPWPEDPTAYTAKESRPRR